MKLKAIKEKRLSRNPDNLSIRAEQTESGEKFIEGYASVFKRESKLIYEYHRGKPTEFYEVIEPGAFDEVLRSEGLNVIHTIDHSPSKMIGRTISGTLQLSVDEIGLKYRVSVPNTTLGNDLYEMIKRGDYYESSFVFTVDDQDERWEERNGLKYRHIAKVSGLYDTSTVVDGAYSNTIVMARSEQKDFDFKSYSNVVTVRDLKDIEIAPTIEPVVLSDSDKLRLEILIAESELF